METSPSYFDAKDLSEREQYRRYRKRLSSSPSPLLHLNSGSKFAQARLLYDDNSIQRRPNAALLLEEIKQEVDSYEAEGFEGEFRMPISSKRRASIDAHSSPRLNLGSEATHHHAGPPLTSIKQEDEVSVDAGEEATFTMFASLLDSALQGLLPFADLILRFKNTCRDVFESIRLVMLYLRNEEPSEDLILSPATSHQEACQFVANDITAQLCLRIVQWLEGLASDALDLDKKVKGSHIGSYLPSSGIWHHTQRYLRRKNDDPAIIQHLDFDAPTREAGQLLLDDRKQEESLLEDVWILLRAGRLEEACDLCRSAGQSWRAATLCPFGGLEQFPSVEAVEKNGKSRVLQAIELESGVGHQWRLWKWASYCASEKIAEQDGGRYETAVYAAQCSNLKRMLAVCNDWESACWAMAKSWLDLQVDLQLSQFQQERIEPMRNYGGDGNGISEEGLASQSLADSESWPQHVIDQQPRDLSSLLQKLHSSDIVHDAVSRACKEQHRQIEMNLMTGDIANLLDVLWSWISPAEDFQNVLRPQCDPQMIRFSAHLVLVLRYLFPDEMKDTFKKKLMTVGDYILHMYALFLFSKQHEELVGVYASQLARHLCIDLFVHMMEEKLNDSLHVKHKIFLSGIRYLPFSSGEDSKASFEDIIERVLSRSRETKIRQYDGESSDVAEQHRLQSLQKANAVQWLCFTPPSAIGDFTVVNAKLLMRALFHSNILFREFALISLWRVPKMPIGAHKLLSFLAELLKQPMETLLSLDEQIVTSNLHEFEDWREYYSCDATYRNWLRFELDNADVPSSDLSLEEKERATAVAKEALAASLLLLEREEAPWMSSAEKSACDPSEHMFIELDATAMLCLASGECLRPDAASCTTLTSALYGCVTEEDVLKRRMMINVAISPRDSYCVEVSLRCLAVDGDGLGFHAADDGGILAAIISAGFKGELSRFQSGVTLEISRLDAWCSDSEGSLQSPATYIVRGLCRRCCLPELVLRCMQICLSLAETGETWEDRDRLVELVASSRSGMLGLFSRQQLQEFLLFERDCTLYRMDPPEEDS
ncbi:unnamed protein product [Spirodela intermedia]|uniref:Nuclear pore complex protein n=1 Tax=Spirodela intermedia TaxID=51605 RepID=A0A7I8KTP1_SPIIN|nr:unnamed protein product [Spirodela intermedia]